MTTFVPEIGVVDFHHTRGPEIEFWVTSEGDALCERNDWSLLPFMALSDGAHTMEEDFSYFMLLDRGEGTEAAAGVPPSTETVATGSSLFGISCTRQIRAERLKRRSADVTRSSVQKAVVVVLGHSQALGELRTRLGAVTAAWFAQEDFSDTTILKEFQESLARNPAMQDDRQDHYFGLSLREMIHEFRHQTLVLFKCLLLQRKVLFFGSKCERLCMMQFALITLIPGLIKTLQDAADPRLDTYAQHATPAVSLKTSERSSLLAYMGLPLQIFGKGSFFGPYTPLQQLDVLADYDTKSYVVGSTNPLLLQQKERYSDIFINLDESNSITITSPSLRAALALSAADRRWIDYLTQTVLDTWDPDNPSRPKNLGYAGSEDEIRLQFEEYILSLLSSMAYQVHHESIDNNRSSTEAQHYPDPGEMALDFNPDFLSMWRRTNNFALFNRLTSGSRIFDIIEPRHPTAGGLSVEDLQRRLQQGVADLHLDERMREGREMMNKTWITGRERMGKLWADLEALREQRAAAARARPRSSVMNTQTERHSQDHSWSRSRQSADGADQKSAAEPPDAKGPDTTKGAAVAVAAVATEERTQESEDLTSGPAAPGAQVSAPPSTSTWASAFHDRAAKVQLPDTTQLQASARENASRAGAYLSGWGNWARERVQQQQQREQKK